MTTMIATPQPAKETLGPRKRWTTAEFDRLLADGYILEGSSAYLWDGEIIEPMAEDPPHVNALANLIEILRSRLPSTDWTLNQDAPVELSDGYKPQPDVSVLKGPRSTFRRRTPTAADVELLIEIADTTYAQHSRPLLRKYAESGIPQYWIVTIPEKRVEVYSEPARTEDGTPCYQARKDYSLKESVSLILARDGKLSELGVVPLIDMLRDSAETSVEGDGA
jgi:Uma2 family endonuclease